MPKDNEIKNYSFFLGQLNTHLNNYSSIPKEKWIKEALGFVDGCAASELRRLVALEKRREFGVFFTPNHLAKIVADEVFPTLNADSVIYDSACGAGNLLLCTWDYLNDKRITPKNEHCLLGTDIYKEFVEAAKSRLAIKQLLVEEAKSELSLKNRFKIEQLDGLTNNPYYEQATHIFVNPPFNMMPVPEDINWSKGVASTAAIFLDRILRYVKAETTITAILPEVLRSGSRYYSWRGMVLSNCKNEKVKLLGRFDKHADVDVFAITLTKRRFPLIKGKFLNKLQPDKKAKRTIKDDFTICVGPVVDNRDKHVGRLRGYIVSRGLPGWSILSRFRKTRKHSGKHFQGPFIVIKRTSRMGDSQRAIAIIINTPNPVYVDNHLIILIPKTRSLFDCKRMVDNLKDTKTDDWLNGEIRCRHLTVSIVSNIPVWE